MPYSTKAGDIMTSPVVTIGPSESVSEAVRLICGKGISGLPVVDDAGRLVGILSKTDLVAWEYECLFDHVYEVDLKPIFSALGEEMGKETASPREGDVPGDSRVESIMKRTVITATPETPLTVVAGLMKKNNIHRVVITVGDKVAGIVTSMDMLKLIMEKSARGGANA